MSSEREIPSQFPTLTAWCEALAREGMNPREIRQKTNCSKSTAYNAVKKADREKEKGTAKKPDVKVEEVLKEVPQIEEATEPAKPLETVSAKLITGAILDPEDLEYLFRALNDLFPDNIQRPDKSMKLLGKVWFKPANRILQEYMEQNVDIYFAGIVTVIVFAPSLYALLKGKFGKKKPEKKEEEE